MIPSGILNPGTTCVIGNGVVVHIPSLLQEIRNLKAAGVDPTGRILISDRAHIVFDFHQKVRCNVTTLVLLADGFERKADGLHEHSLATNKLGTTGKGIGPAYSSKAVRNGKLSVCHYLHFGYVECQVFGWEICRIWNTSTVDCVSLRDT